MGIGTTAIFPEDYLAISISKQQLSVMQAGVCVGSYPVSTAKKGAGQLQGSGCTPTGWHKIRAKIGQNAPLCSVFVGRRTTGEIYTSQLAAQYPQRDWILTRILWLGGLEPHKNRYGEVDTTWRYIYIHGSPYHVIDGTAQSHGCIRMKNADVLDLFERVSVGLRVFSH